jgi:osmotically inducible protein OsmC
MHFESAGAAWLQYKQGEIFMPVRKGRAVWQGGFKEGKGYMETGGGAIRGDYSVDSRFENALGTNPEELIAAAHAGCFSMALALLLGNAGFTPKKIETQAEVSIEPENGGFAIKVITLTVEAEVPGINKDRFKEIAAQAKEGCPVSKALAAVPQINLEAILL